MTDLREFLAARFDEMEREARQVNREVRRVAIVSSIAMVAVFTVNALAGAGLISWWWMLPVAAVSFAAIGAAYWRWGRS